MLEFSTDAEMQKIPELAEEFYNNILDEEDRPVFVSDEATVWGVWMSTAEELLRRVTQYYGKPVTMDDLKQPFWKLLRRLNEGRSAGRLR
jgi:hypothetical protein